MISNTKTLQSSNDIHSFPSELKFCSSLYDYISYSAHKTHPTASLAALFAIASAITARGYYTHTKASTSLYVIMIGKTGVGKNSIVQAPQKVLKALSVDEKILTSSISSTGAINDIFKNQTTAIHIIDEFGDTLGHMMADKGGHLKQVASQMKELYSMTNGTYKSVRYSTAGGKNKVDKPWTLERPCYGIIGLTTQVQLLEQLKESMLHDGFLNRFIILNGQDIKPIFPQNPLSDIPPNILKHLESIKQSGLVRIYDDNNKELPFEEEYFQNDEHVTIKLSAEASIYYNETIGDADIEGSDIASYCEDDESEVKRAISVRWRENSLRLAVALTALEKLEEVSLEVLEWCYELVKNSSISFLTLFEKDAYTTKYETLKSKAIRWFERQDSDEQFLLSYLARSARPFSTLPSRERKELLDDLVESHIISEQVDGNTFTYSLVST